MSAKPVFMGVDLGGTGAKAGIFDSDGRPLGIGHQGYSPKNLGNGRAEIPIETIYEAARAAVHQALEAAGKPAVVALAISSQGQTFATIDEKGRSLHPAILWYDSRAGEQAARLIKKFEVLPAQERPPVNVLSSSAKILWLNENMPDIMAPAWRYLLLPDYLSYRLTGEAVIDSNTATSIGMQIEGATDFSFPALHIAGIPREQLSRILRPGTPIARLTSSAASEWGLSPETLLVAGTNDQYAGALGAGNNAPGIITETTGTCLALVTLTERLPSPMPQGLYGGHFPIAGLFFLLAYSKTAGLLLHWFQQVWADGKSLADLDAEAATVSPGSRGITLLPHFDGAVSPVPDPAVRGAFSGLTLEHTRADMYRAILESLAFSLRENVENIVLQGFKPSVIRSIGGGAKSDLWLQIKADVLGLPVEKPCVTESAVLGAAMIAAVGQGTFRSLSQASAGLYRPAKQFIPNLSLSDTYQEAYQRYIDLRKKLY